MVALVAPWPCLLPASHHRVRAPRRRLRPRCSVRATWWASVSRRSVHCSPPSHSSCRQCRAMSTARPRHKPRPAGAPEASLSARACPRLPQAPASLGQSPLGPRRPAIRASLSIYIGAALDLGERDTRRPWSASGHLTLAPAPAPALALTSALEFNPNHNPALEPSPNPSITLSGQPPEVAALARHYMLLLLPALAPFSIFEV